MPCRGVLKNYTFLFSKINKCPSVDTIGMMRLIVVSMVTALAIIFISQQMGGFNAYASESSPYDSGYSQGCDDAGISDPDDRYINQPEKGPAFHTEEFMSGYDNGFESCAQDSSNENCDSSYPDVCIASPPPDLNCDDVPYKNIKVQGNDPHGFDRDSDGIGCES